MSKSFVLLTVLIGAAACADFASSQDTQPSSVCPNPNARFEVTWATYIGGPRRDWLNKVVVLPDQSIVVAGWTTADGAPTTDGVVQPKYAGGPFKPTENSRAAGDFYLAHLTPSGKLLAATYFGGSDMEYQLGLAVDRKGNVIVSGQTSSPDLPTTPGAAQPTFGGDVDWFAAKLTPDLKQLLWCTYLGGPGGDSSWGGNPVLDADDDVILFGQGQNGFPQSDKDRNAGSSSPTDSSDLFVAKLKADGSGVVFCSRFGGDGQDAAKGGVVLKDGSIILTGITRSKDFPWPEATVRVGPLGDLDGFVAKLKADGSDLVAMTLFGGTNSDFPGEPVVAADGSIVVAGSTWSADFPTTPGAYQCPAGAVIDDGFVLRLAEPGRSVQFAATIRGEERADVKGAKLGRDGLIWVGGTTASLNLTLTGDALGFYYGGESDGLLAALSNDGSRLVFSTFLGGIDKDSISDFAFGSGGEIYVVGGTTSADLPTSTASVQQRHAGREDGFIMKLVPRRPGLSESRGSGR